MASLYAPISPLSQNHIQKTGLIPLMFREGSLNIFRSKLPFRSNKLHITGNSNCSTTVRASSIGSVTHILGVMAAHGIYPKAANATLSSQVFPLPEAIHRTATNVTELPESMSENLQRLLVTAELDPSTAKLAIAIIGPFLSAFGFLFIIRIVMSWYPKLPVGKFPFVIAYAPTEPLLGPTRKVIPPVGGVDVTPVVWFGLTSFLNEILVGPQGLLVLLSQQISGI